MTLVQLLEFERKRPPPARAPATAERPRARRYPTVPKRIPEPCRCGICLFCRAYAHVAKKSGLPSK